MADFVAVLKKTLGGLDSPPQQMREKVYDKARTTISAKLAAISPPPPADVIERQRAALEKAIADIEAEYRQGEANVRAEEDPLADFISGKAFGSPTPPPAMPAAAAPAISETNEEVAAPAETPQPAEPTPVATAPTPAKPAKEPVKSSQDKETVLLAGSGSATAAKKRSKTGLIAAVIVLLVLAGAAYGIWQNKEDFARMAGLEQLLGNGEEQQAEAQDNAGANEENASPADTEEAGADEGAPAAEDEEQKFTQRLLEDGSEVDPGPAGDEPSVGEGTSVAEANKPADQDASQETAAADPDPTAEEPEQTGAEAPEGTALPVGQRAIFYEERTSDLQGSAEPGAVVWSLVQESPGGNLPPEPAIRAEATIPEKGLQFKMTIRRNGDKSLPASHIIEMIFITSDEVDGGGIENVLRITFKDSEQSAGNPLLGIPAKISDGFFLLALTDSKADIEANTTMMRRLDWLDIPLVYNSGRRALITMEKGVPGEKVFDEALKAWTPENSG